ncbi:centromere subunit L [Immersiella caudata]|uniref:Centromere subunit L n=1 Tax=Immersiella caudata TaxID=314043 RepID=A0AA39WSG0_9PEZI|nr:centromere subunit L [Immersiella caudata]
MPLLLLRMPVPLKGVISEFLATEFDCRVSALRLGTRSMVGSWEGWIRTAGLPTRGLLAKDVVVTLGFYIPPKERVEDEDADEEGSGQLGLKSIDVFVPAAELRKFVDAGADLERTKRKGTGATWEEDVAKRRKLAGKLHEEGWEWRQVRPDEEQSPFTEQHFTEALGRYVDKHLGLNLFHPGVRITKIACGGFVMSEGRIKVFAPADLGDADGGSSSSRQRVAIWGLLKGLVGKAKGDVGK